MKLLFASVLLAWAPMTTFAADDATFTGKWQLHTSVSDHENDMSCTLTQSDNNLTGTCSPEEGTVPISGKVEGKNITWTYKSKYDGSPLTVTFKGKSDSAGKMSGSVIAEEYGAEGVFTATQSK
jgi:hypothetical protein